MPSERDKSQRPKPALDLVDVSLTIVLAVFSGILLALFMDAFLVALGGGVLVGIVWFRAASESRCS